LKNVDEIASVPGVGAIFVGAGGDLHQYLGVPFDSPELEQARQTILTACKAHNVPCGITALTKPDVEKRLKEGWRMIRTGRADQLETTNPSNAVRELRTDVTPASPNLSGRGAEPIGQY
jgi:2-keto-3-deoxy-L-rhamnonate aldolase RhmA